MNVVCPACATECPEGSRFCLRCGSSLLPARAQRVERRVVTVLFADLVGFTRLCEQNDPEDVDRLLRDYYALARSAIEAYGGVVEKYIGDAVVGVFGVPKAYEDDAERAVRAGLRLIDRLEEVAAPSTIEVRVGINTGSALARLDVDPHSGQGFLVGDAVNVASRLQAAAPPMRVVVGELTYNLACGAIDFEAMEPLAAKGKAEALQPWLVIAPVARLGIELGRVFSTPFVGREVELGILKGLFEKAAASSSPQFAFVTGEAGIGKSRLVFELAHYVDLSSEWVATWRQGRALPYEEGVPFWSLSEIVRGQGGILEGDDEETAVTKLRRALPEGPDTDWILGRLRPLLGIACAPASQDENFAAWRRFIETIARTGPLVLVFEDQQWARSETFAFLEHLAAHLSGVPVLVVAVARPELRGRQPRFGAGEPWVAIDVKSLSPTETRRLIVRLGGSEAAEMEATIAGRCGGNPLFTEQLVRLITEQSSPGCSPSEQGKRPAETPFPESLAALVAARLDALHPSLKAVLTDASVVGQTFWPGVLVAMSGGDRTAIETHLDELGKREFVRALPASSVQDEPEYSFWHGLTREVAYRQLPRALRAAKHKAVAQWTEVAAAGRLGDVADILAYHYETAHDLARASGETSLADDVRQPTVRALALAGDHTLPLDVPAAERRFARAVALAAEGNTERPRLLVSWGEALAETGCLREGARTIEEGINLLLAAGDRRAAATAMTRLDWILSIIDSSGPEDLVDQAERLLEGEDPSPEFAKVLEHRAATAVACMDNTGAIEAANRAIALCRRLALPCPTVAVGCRGTARGLLGDDGGIADLETGLKEAKKQGLGRTAGALSCNLAEILSVYRGPGAALEERGQGLEFAVGRGDLASVGYLREGMFSDLIWVGQWDEALEDVDELDRLLEGSHYDMDLQRCRANRALLLSWRGDTDYAEAFACGTLEECRRSQLPSVRCSCLFSYAVFRSARGAVEDAAEALRALDGLPRGVRCDPDYAYRVPHAGRMAVAVGQAALAARLMDGMHDRRALDSHALVSIRASLEEDGGELETAADSYAEAAQRWRDFGVPYEEAQARLAQGRCLLALGRASEAIPVLTEARAIFARLGAKLALAEGDALLKHPAVPRTI